MGIGCPEVQSASGQRYLSRPTQLPGGVASGLLAADLSARVSTTAVGALSPALSRLSLSDIRCDHGSEHKHTSNMAVVFTADGAELREVGSFPLLILTLGSRDTPKHMHAYSARPNHQEHGLLILPGRTAGQWGVIFHHCAQRQADSEAGRVWPGYRCEWGVCTHLRGWVLLAALSTALMNPLHAFMPGGLSAALRYQPKQAEGTAACAGAFVVVKGEGKCCH